MTFEITDHVSGLSDEQVAKAAAEAERGYEIAGRPTEHNPHASGAQMVPVDLLDEIEQRATQDGESPDELVRRALIRYLRSA